MGGEGRGGFSVLLDLLDFQYQSNRTQTAVGDVSRVFLVFGLKIWSFPEASTLWLEDRFMFPDHRWKETESPVFTCRTHSWKQCTLGEETLTFLF